ncbi:MAG: divergent polysaccharide deacetylase family protein [Myxococcota bacterium]|nr:divergent polysaccharide deacetylase family protein [Myxococcota bacterium]
MRSGLPLLSVVTLLLAVSVGSAWYFLRPRVTPLHPPHEAQERLIEALIAHGVPRGEIKGGLYPLFGPGRQQDELLPLVSFSCPVRLGCEQLFAAISAPLLELGYTFRQPLKLLSAGRPIYRALSFGERPTLIVRAYPGEFRLAVLLEGLGSVSVMPRDLLRLDPDCSFAVNPLSRGGEGLYQLLTRNQREVYLSLPLGDASAALEPHATEVFLQRIGRLLDRHDWVGVSGEPGEPLLTHHPALLGLLERLHQRRQIFIDEGHVFASLGEAVGRESEVRVVRSTHQLPTESGEMEAALRGLEAHLVLSGEAVLEVPAQTAAQLSYLRAWLDKMKERGVHLLRLSELAL